MRALLETDSHFCEVVVLKLRTFAEYPTNATDGERQEAVDKTGERNRETEETQNVGLDLLLFAEIVD